MDAHQDLHERTLARPVFAKQRMDLSRAQFKANVVQNCDVAKRLADADHTERNVVQEPFLNRLAAAGVPDPAPPHRRCRVSASSADGCFVKAALARGLLASSSEASCGPRSWALAARSISCREPASPPTSQAASL